MSRRTSVFLLVVLALVGCSPRLLAAVDRRVGEKTLTGSSDPWADVTDTFGVWADAVIGRLQAGGGPTRVLPWWAQPR
jgi:hypothetical protein